MKNKPIYGFKKSMGGPVRGHRELWFKTFYCKNSKPSWDIDWKWKFYTESHRSMNLWHWRLNLKIHRGVPYAMIYMAIWSCGIKFHCKSSMAYRDIARKQVFKQTEFLNLIPWPLTSKSRGSSKGHTRCKQLCKISLQ